MTIPDDKLPALPEAVILGVSRFGSIFKGHTDATLRDYAREAVEAASQWRPIAEAPEGRPLIVGWIDGYDEENPERIDFDMLEDGVWMTWSEHHEHVMAIGGWGVSEKPAYTHWMQPRPIPKD